ncbi:MAG: hypothetical protein LBJ64_04925 [Deltaproteobacteria bacterium]|jgi:hypothetical protein|nr:hypothetical protein [Deltaproteobacteria bacterium]
MNPGVSVFYLLLCLAAAYWGRNRRFGFWGFFFGSLLLTPAVGLLLVIASAPIAGASDEKRRG